MTRLKVWYILYVYLSLFLSQYNVVLAWIPDVFLEQWRNAYTECDGCFCVLDGQNKTCPNELKPKTDYKYMIPSLRAMNHINPYTLDCNPYDENTNCTTIPEQVEGSACIAEFTSSGPDDACLSPWSYKLTTYSAGTLDEALEAVANRPDAYIAHGGKCGACSSLQDASIYMEQGADLARQSTLCGFAALFLGVKHAAKCFQRLGFTSACAQIWAFNTAHTRSNCGGLCIPYTLHNNAPNGPGPACKLAACIDCDETISGPVFQDVAGRTRRNSGLRSGILRSCSEMELKVVPVDPCGGTVIPAVTG